MEDITKNWVKKDRDVQSDIAMWDSQSDDPTYQRTYDGFLKLLEEEQMLDKSFDVLDVGCGAGAYSIALSEQVRSAIGTDLSPKMLVNGAKRAKENGIKNVTFLQADWSAIDLEYEGFHERFDLVFAHNTPAVCDVTTFEKINQASRRFCAVCAPIIMIEPVMQQVQSMLFDGNETKERDNSFTYMIDILLQKGYLPKLNYEKQVWPMNQSFEDACAYYIGKTQMSKDLTEQQITQVREYLKTLVRNDVITDTISTTTATIYWEKV